MIKNIFQTAWHLSKGYKLTFWGGLFLVLFASLVIWGVMACLSYYAVHYAGMNEVNVSYISSVLQTFFILPAYVGLILLGIKRVNYMPVRSLDVFNYYSKIWGLFGVYFLQMLVLTIVGGLLGLAIFFMNTTQGVVSILMAIVTFLIGIFIIYLSIGYTFSLPLRIEKRIGLWHCLEASRKAITPIWFSVLAIVLISVFFILLGTLPLLIGLIWVLPWVNLALGALYLRLFGPLKTENL